MAKTDIIMVGPDIKGLGGISRVVQIWSQSAIFNELSIRYIDSVKENGKHKYLFLLKQLIIFIKTITLQNCIIYIHTSSYMSFWRKSSFILLSSLFGKRIFLHIHPTHFFSFVKKARGIQKRLIYFILDKTDHFVVLSEDMKEKMQGEFGGKKITVLRNPVNIRDMNEGMDHCRREDNRLLYLGWYIREKGIFELADAAELLIQEGFPIHIDFYGTKESESLKRHVNGKQSSSALSINGWIGGDDKLRALHTCTALVLPSYSEGLPNVILEAMATRTPIISTPVGGLAEVLKDGENAFVVKPRDAVDLAQKIRECFTDREKRAALSAQAYKEAQEKYDIRIIEGEFQQMIDAAANRCNAG